MKDGRDAQRGRVMQASARPLRPVMRGLDPRIQAVTLAGLSALAAIC
jgi:hypothetical protein